MFGIWIHCFELLNQEKHALKSIGEVESEHFSPRSLSRENSSSFNDVNKQVLINFSMDEILCDVFPMEVKHLLLGRPWQFDKNTLHDGHTKNFSFHFHAKNITLAPLLPQEVKEDQNKMKKQKKM